MALKRKGYNIVDPVQYFEGIKKYIHQGLDWYCSAWEYISLDQSRFLETISGRLGKRKTWADTFFLAMLKFDMRLQSLVIKAYIYLRFASVRVFLAIPFHRFWHTLFNKWP